MTETRALSSWLADVGARDAFVALADLSPDCALYVVDDEQNVVHWSRGAERLLGFTSHDVVGQHCLKGSRCVECLTGCGVKERGHIEAQPLEIYAKDGTTRRVTKHARAFFDDDGRFVGAIEILMPAEPVRAARALPIVAQVDDEVSTKHGIVTRSPAMRAVLQTLENVARTDVTVLVRGESGTGKELVARAIHAESHRASGPFLAQSCAAMSATLLESELFGHEKGAFTGAQNTHHGLFERADGGTLFLDEVAELPLELQAKLLRVLETRTFYRVGGSKELSVDVRLVSATHRSLRDEVARGRFREDLMYRLRVVPIFLPTLRERREDVPLLVEHFVRLLSSRGPRRVTEIEPEAMRAILAYPWPGNVRELRNAIEYAFAVGRGETLTLRDLPRDLVEPPREGPPPVTAAARTPMPSSSIGDERTRIARALEEAGGHIGDAAAALGMSRPTLWRKRKKLGL